MKWLIIAVVALVVVFGVAVPLYLAPNDIAGCSVPSDSGKCQRADAIVAISGGDTTARADEAISLYKSGWAKTVVFSGAASDTSGPSNALVMQRDAESKGVPADATIIDENAKTTGENATNVAAIASEHGFRRLLLVTSSYHQRRASLEFHRAAGSTVTIVNHPVSSDNQWSSLWWATPIGWWLSMSELVKIGAFYTGLS